MSKTKLFSFISAAALVMLTFACLAGQSRAQGRYTNVYSKRDVGNIIANLERSSNTFRQDFNRFMDQSSLNGTRDEDRFNAAVGDFANSLDRLRRDFDRSNTWWQSRNEVQDVMSSARPVNEMMNGLPFARKLDRQWTNMRRDLNKLADTFDLPDLAGGGFGGGTGGGFGGGVGGGIGGGQQGSVPSWATGTFYGRNPQTGEMITLTISPNGGVTINFGTSVEYATIYRQQMNHDGIRSRVERIGNGIATIRTDNGERIEYYRNWNGAGGIGVGGQQGEVPSWAVGTFSATNPQTGGRITLTISQNGAVAVDFGTSIDYASVYRDQLTNNGVVSRIERTRNGIATVRLDNGERIDYRRR